MRRISTQIITNNKNTLKEQNKRKYKTYVQTNVQQFFKKLTKNNLLSQGNHSTHMFSQYVVKEFLYNMLLNEVDKELDKLQLKKIVQQTMNQCSSLLNHQNWQINPSGPFSQNTSNQQTLLKPDQQPKLRLFDPKLGFNNSSNNKAYIKNSIKTQSSIKQSESCISLSRIKKNSKFYHMNLMNSKSSFKYQTINTNKFSSKKSILSSTSKRQSHTQSTNPIKLIPLRLQTNYTPQNQSKRTLQDFLRDKKTNTDPSVQLQNLLKNDKQRLKTIQQFQKSYLVKTSRNLFQNSQLSPIQQTKLPFLTSRQQQIATDYNGQRISIKKTSRLKKHQIEILKPKYKVNNCEKENKSANKDNKKHNILKKYQSIKLKSIEHRKQSINSNSLCNKSLLQGGCVKDEVQYCLRNNRVMFKELNQNQGKFVWVEEKVEEKEKNIVKAGDTKKH